MEGTPNLVFNFTVSDGVHDTSSTATLTVDDEADQATLSVVNVNTFVNPIMDFEGTLTDNWDVVGSSYISSNLM